MVAAVYWRIFKPVLAPSLGACLRAPVRVPIAAPIPGRCVLAERVAAPAGAAQGVASLYHPGARAFKWVPS
ncbi:hypothetical protein D3C86_1898330 [compost metagenome]